ncbi:hypothetical protein JCM15765_36740 [Paradesulfitobacterium aromaticivorans]
MKKKVNFVERAKSNVLPLNVQGSGQLSEITEYLVDDILSENFELRQVLESLTKALLLDFAGIWWLSSDNKIELLEFAGSQIPGPEAEEWNCNGRESGIVNLLSCLNSSGLTNPEVYSLFDSQKVVQGWLIVGSKSSRLAPEINKQIIANLTKFLIISIHKKQHVKHRERIKSVLKNIRLLSCSDILILADEDLMRKCLEIMISSGLFEDAEVLLKREGAYTYVSLTRICSYESSNSLTTQQYEFIRNAEEGGEVYFSRESSGNAKDNQVCSIPIYGLKNILLGLVNLYCYSEQFSMFKHSQISGLQSIAWLLGQLLEWSEIRRQKEDIRKKLMSLQFALQKISANLELSQVLSDIVNLAAQTLSAKLAWISLVRKETAFLRPDAFVGLDTEYVNKIQVTIDDSVTSKGPSGKAIKTKQPHLIRDTQLDPDFGPWREQTGQYGYRSIVAVPILFDNKALGMIAVYSSEVDAFSSEDIEILQAFADFSAVAINNACLIDELQQRLKKEQEMCRVAENHTILLEGSVNVFRELSRLLLEGQTIEDMIRALARLVGNPVRVEDRRKVVYWESDFSADFPAMEQILKHPALARERKSLCKILEPVYLQANPSRGYPFDQLVAPIVLGQEVWGYISIVSTTNVINKFGFMVIDKAATVLGMALLKEKTALEIHDQLGKGFLQDFIDGKKNEDEMLREAGYFNYDLIRSSYVMVVDVGALGEGLVSGQSLLRLKTLESLRTYLKSSFEFSLVVANDRFALILIDKLLINQDYALLNKHIKRIKQILTNYLPDKKTDFFTIISAGLASGVKEIRTVFLEAAQHIELARLLNRRGQAFTFEELEVYALIYKTYQKEGIEWLSQFVTKHIGNLLLKDRHGVMLDTLKEFINLGKHVDQTAKKLFTHPNTISYRIKKIEDILKISLDNSEQVQKVILALKGHELLKGLIGRQSP